MALETEYRTTLTIEDNNLLSNIDLTEEPIYHLDHNDIDYKVKFKECINKEFMNKISRTKKTLNNHLKNINLEIVGLDKNYNSVSGKVCIRRSINHNYNYNNDIKDFSSLNEPLLYEDNDDIQYRINQTDKWLMINEMKETITNCKFRMKKTKQKLYPIVYNQFINSDYILSGKSVKIN